MKIEINNKLKENINAFLLILFIFKSSILFPISNLIGSGIGVWILVGFILLISFRINRLEFKLDFIIISACIIIFFIFNLSIVSYKLETLYIMNQFIINGLLILYLATQDIDYKKLIKYWYLLAIVNLLIWIYNIYIVRYENLGYMGIGITLTYSFIIFNYNSYSNKYKYFNVLLSIITFAILFIEGNRSSAIICIAYAIYNEFMNLKRKNIINIIIRLSIIIFLIYSIIFKLSDILYFIQDILNNMDIRSYSITKIIMAVENGLESSLSGRDTLYQDAINIIYNSNFMPKGIGYFETITGYVYPHNFILELCITFGVLAIPLITIVIFFTFIKLKSIKNSQLLDIVFMLLIFALIRLSFSGMFWSEMSLWATIGLLINSKVNKRIVKI